MHTSTCYVAGYRSGLIEEVDPREIPFPRAEGETWYGASCPHRTLERSHWDPQREIEECLDLIKQARHRCEDAFRQSAFLDEAKANLRRRGEPTPGPGARRGDRKGKAQVRRAAAHRGGPGARALLGLDQHLHLHEEHRRAGPRRLGAALHHRAPGRHRVEQLLPLPRLERGHQHLGPVPLHGLQGAGAVPRRSLVQPRHHPRRHGDERDDRLARRAARGHGAARLPLRIDRHQRLPDDPLLRARRPLQAAPGFRRQEDRPLRPDLQPLRVVRPHQEAVRDPRLPADRRRPAGPRAPSSTA